MVHSCTASVCQCAVLLHSIQRAINSKQQCQPAAKQHRLLADKANMAPQPLVLVGPHIPAIHAHSSSTRHIEALNQSSDQSDNGEFAPAAGLH